MTTPFDSATPTQEPERMTQRKRGGPAKTPTPLHLCPCCGSLTRQAPIPVSRPTELRAGDPVIFFSRPLDEIVRGEWLGMDPQFPWEGRVLVIHKRYAPKGQEMGTARLLMEPRHVWREGMIQTALNLPSLEKIRG